MILSLTLLSCSDDVNKIDPLARIAVQVEKGKTTRAEDMERAKFITLYAWNYIAKHPDDDGYIRKDISSLQPEVYYMDRDTVNYRILFWGIDVIDEDKLGRFISYENVVLHIALNHDTGLPQLPLEYTGRLDMPWDTVAYIPNAVMRRNKAILTEIFERGDYNKCYEVFDTAYRFIPITGAEYRELVRKGEH